MVHFAYRSCSHVMSSQMQNEVPFMKENRLLFTNALIVLPTETIKGSLAVEDGKITGIFESGTELPGFTEVDVHGKALMPGAIDTHVHMWDPSPLNYREDWACGSQCAASGGITTIIDMPLSVPPVVDKEGFQLKLDVAQKESCVDFAFWGGLTPNCVQNMEELNRLGCVAYKGFMSFANPDYPQVTDGYLVQGMRKAATFNGLIGVHAENAEVADFGSKEMLDFIYIEDCVEAIAKISLADHNPHAEYNIGGGEVIPYTRIIDKARKLFPTAPIHVGPGDLGYDNLGALSVQRAFEDFGWKPRFSIEQGMEQYMNWLKNF